MKSTYNHDDLVKLFTPKEEGLQTLYHSLSQEWEQTLESKKIEKLDEFMAKWVDGVSALFALEDGAPEKESRRSPFAAKGLAAMKKSLSPKKIKPLTGISPSEAEEMLQMLKNLEHETQVQETQAPTAPLPLSLELEVQAEAPPFMIPVSLKNFYRGIIVLQVNNPGFMGNPQILQSKNAVLRFIHPESQETMRITGTVTWPQSTNGQPISVNFKMAMKPIKPPA
jgi:hypothetical protein